MVHIADWALQQLSSTRRFDQAVISAERPWDNAELFIFARIDSEAAFDYAQDISRARSPSEL
jgi:hypothetical protein